MLSVLISWNFVWNDETSFPFHVFILISPSINLIQYWGAFKGICIVMGKVESMCMPVVLIMFGKLCMYVVHIDQSYIVLERLIFGPCD